MTNPEPKLPALAQPATEPLTDLPALYHRFMIGAICLAVGLALVFPPKSWEGPSLLHLSRGRGITVSDLVALIPLALGVNFILTVLWRLRAQLRQQIATLWKAGGGEIFLAGLAVGIFVDGAVSNLDWRHSTMALWVVMAVALTLVALTRRK